MRVSFCTSYKGRLGQLAETLPRNILSLDERCELVIANLDGTDEIFDWVTNEFSEFLEMGRIRIFTVMNVTEWSSPVAKNIAHKIALGDYLFNLDADNFITPKDISLIRSAAVVDASSFQWSGKFGDGSFGRIGMPRKVFQALGGYDESLLPMGAQDLDLLNRIAKIREPILQLQAPEISAIQNDKLQDLSTNKDKKKLWDEMNKVNLNISAFKIENLGPYRKNFPLYLEGHLNGTPAKLLGSRLSLEPSRK
jgi:hypothetical protein